MNRHADRCDAQSNAIDRAIVNQEGGTGGIGGGALNARHQRRGGRAGAAAGRDGGPAVDARPGAGPATEDGLPRQVG